MIKNKITFLIETALQSELKGNLVSLIFAKNPNIDIRKRESFYDNVSPFFKKYSESDRSLLVLDDTSEKDVLSDWLGHDFRIKRIRFKSIRGFPDSPLPFGFDLLNDQGKPQSIVILGSNGSGKSSVFSALEYSYCRKIGEAQLRTNIDISEESNRFEDFLDHFESGFNKCSCLYVVKLKCTIGSHKLRCYSYTNIHHLSS